MCGRTPDCEEDERTIDTHVLMAFRVYVALMQMWSDEEEVEEFSEQTWIQPFCQEMEARLRELVGQQKGV